MVRGRVATGYLTVGAATGLMPWQIDCNGPADREERRAWEQTDGGPGQLGWVTSTSTTMV